MLLSSFLFSIYLVIFNNTGIAKQTKLVSTYFEQDVFQRVALDTVDSCLRGFSGAIFAYGQTNSGKTWTVTGGEGVEEQGLAPRAIGHLFRGIRNAETSGQSVRYEVRLGRVEPTTAANVCPDLKAPRDKAACMI